MQKKLSYYLNEIKNINVTKNTDYSIVIGNSEVILYGAGNMGLATLEWLKNSSVKTNFFLDRNEEKNGKTIDGIPIILPDMVSEAEKKETPILVAITARPFGEIKKYLQTLGYKHIYPAGDYIQKLFPNLILANIWDFGELELDKKKLEGILKIFNDWKSWSYYLEVIKWFVNRTESENALEVYFPPDICALLREKEFFLDTALLGTDYVDKIWNKLYFEKIIDSPLIPEDLSKIKNRFKNNKDIKILDYELGKENKQFSIQRMGLIEPYTNFEKYIITAKKIDTVCSKQNITFLRCYSMDPCMDIVEGAIETIKKYRPIIAVNIGHYKKDFIEIPLLLKNELTEYAYFFRQHGYHGHYSILYAIPKERYTKKYDRKRIKE